MSNANIGWLFYKDYFNDLDYANLSNKANEEKIKARVTAITAVKFTSKDEEILGSTRFQGTTSYPGLILGSGNAHEIPDVKGQAILGFHFDYTSGLPIIQGSSIKGVLRSAFKHPEYIQDLLDDESMDVESLEKEIFDNADIFFDAHIIKADAYDRVLGDDYITPHNDLLKDPIPLRFIKVLPDVTFLFEFKLSGEGLLSKYDKEKLFRDILADLGLGAKTNVGYGKFMSFDKAPRTKEEESQDKIDAENRLKAEAEKREAEVVADREAKKKAEEEKQNRLANEAQAKLDEAETKKRELASQGLETVIADVQKFKALEGLLKKYIEVTTLSEEDKLLLEAHVRTMKDKIKKKKFPYAVFNNNKCLGKERTEALVNTLGLK